MEQRITQDLSRRQSPGGTAALLAPCALPQVAAQTPVKNAQVIDCRGKPVLPGLIDTHWHTLLASISQLSAATANLGYRYLVAAHEAQRTMMRVFTSMRDAGGPAFALKRAIDEGLVAGPRIFASGATISRIWGHRDLRLRSDAPRAGSMPNPRGFMTH